ncbi:MAG: BrnT family toxin [Gammaproteobacteria bacterium]|nr:BrnT family toxin [Gammaproteobacteria bacterium]MYC59901.1 BrnT family toxin [Gammaproteobacteria bacterium]MYH47422.1 BrnT family toxin [Gammaproteobacteria bacterium]MYL12394.1 BrnT family toxin [Gammaproteobacteria bacterium]
MVIWDQSKARSNLAKHGVAFEDAELVLSDPVALTIEDPDALTERRQVTIGMDALSRVIVVVFTQRGEAARIISARKATRKEREAYAEGI